MICNLLLPLVAVAVLVGLGTYACARCNFDQKLVVPLLATTALALYGYYAVHYLAARCDRANEKRDLRVRYLLEAYRRLESGCARYEKLTDQQQRDIESAVADIQLLGTPDQIALAKRAIQEIESSSHADPRALLVNLRADLRGELDIGQVSLEPTDILHLRIHGIPPDAPEGPEKGG